MMAAHGTELTNDNLCLVRSAPHKAELLAKQLEAMKNSKLIQKEII